jgi:acetyl-CoA carboxylase biotin carboxyl carrier protein
VTDNGAAAGRREVATDGVAALVESLAAVMQQTTLTELDLSLGDLSLRMRRTAGDGLDIGVAGTNSPPGISPPPTAAEHVIAAPMIGTFYASPTPGSPSFVSEGDEIVVGQTVGIIEAMKIMNEIAADRSGTITTVLVDNGQAVEYGTPLMLLATVKSESR